MAIRAYQAAFTAGVLSPALWARVDLSKYQSGLKVGRNVFVHAHGGASNRPGLEFVAEVKNSAHGARNVPFQFNTEQTYELSFGNGHFRVIKDGGVVLVGGIPYECVTPYLHGHLDDLVFTQEADVMYVTHEDFAPRKISRLAEDNWTIETVVFAPKITAPTGVNIEVFSGSTDVMAINSYRVSAIHKDTGEESLPSAAVTVTSDITSINGSYNLIKWTAHPDASRYIVYKQTAGAFGYMGATNGTQLDDKNITPDLSDGPQQARNPFNGTGKYPRCSTFIEQRLAFASTKDDPQAIFMSQSANYENFGVAQPAKASDAVTFRIKSRQMNVIRSLLASRGLLALGSGSEWIVSGGSQSDAITPSSIKIDNHGYRGASKVQPIVVGNTVLFSQQRGGVIRDFSYEFSQDSFTGKDLTILSRHFFKNKNVKAWGYSQAPDSIVWVVMSDGSLLSLTYLKEHDVWAWTSHESGPNGEAIFEDVSVVAEDNEDVPYFIVRRTINGSQKRYVERMRSRAFDVVEDAFFVDCGLTYTGAAATVISGLDHLEGQAVVALANGNVVRNLVVSAGSVTLPNPATKVHVGLPMVAAMQTLDLDLGQIRGLGTVQGRLKSISEVVMRVEQTRGIFTGTKDGDRNSPTLTEYKQRSIEAWNEAIQLYTGDINITVDWDWSTGGNLWIKQFDPLPMTILAVMPDVTIGR